MNTRTIIFAAAATLLIPAAASAQTGPGPGDDPAPDMSESAYSGDHLTIGAGAIYSPSYEGSDHHRVSAIPIVQASYGGITLNPMANGANIDVIPDAPGAKLGFGFGPAAAYSTNRARHIDDDVVELTGRLKKAFDVGATGSVSINHVTNPYDKLSFSVTALWNVNSASKGMTIQPTVSFLTPLSKAMLVNLSVTAKHVSGNYASYYYDVSAAQSLASGLPVYNAGSGWASFGSNLLFGYDLNGNLLDGGFAIIGIGSYTHLMNDAHNTPYTRIRGDRNNWTVGGGLAYTF